MAGLGRKVFAAGDVLAAADVDGYLMDQSVMKFASDAARSSAIGTAVSAGMTSYRTDAKTIEVYDGASWNTLGAPDVAGKNKIINGGFDFWQRGTSFSNPTVQQYTADRWRVEHDGTGATRTISQQAFTPGTAPVAGYEANYFFRYVVSGGTGNTYQDFRTIIEDVRTFANQTATISFWAKSDASRVVYVLWRTEFGSGGSAADQGTIGSITLSTSWTRYSITYTYPTVSGKTIGAGSNLQILFRLPAATAQTVDIWGVQLEAGSVATPFSRAGGTIQGELAACQRYYQRWGGQSAYGLIGLGQANSTTVLAVSMNLPVTMRTVPSSVEYSTLAVNGSGILNSVSAVSIGASTTSTILINATTTGLTANMAYLLLTNNSTSGYLGLTAEL